MQRHGSDDVVRIARGWLGTPYHHQASECGIGTDCLGLVRGVWRELFGGEAELPAAYTRDWAEAAARETMLEAASRHLLPGDRGDLRPGDVLIFRMRTGFAAKHAGIVSGTDRMVHAMEGVPVTEIALTPWWRRRIAAVYSFPEVER